MSMFEARIEGGPNRLAGITGTDAATIGMIAALAVKAEDAAPKGLRATAHLSGLNREAAELHASLAATTAANQANLTDLMDNVVARMAARREVAGTLARLDAIAVESQLVGLEAARGAMQVGARVVGLGARISPLQG